MLKPLLRSLVAVGALFLVSGCSTVSYLWQATRGQLKLTSRMRAIEEVIQDPRTDPETVRILGYVAGIKAFGESQGLKRTRNYEHFVQWDDSALVWVVSATPEFSLANRNWHFPIVGEVPYLGFFERARAEEFERTLKSEGLETYLRGAAAYSSLGYFQDPLVSTLWQKGDQDSQAVVADTVIHESVHATLYIAGQSALNESVAEFIASQLTPVYLESVGAVTLRENWTKRSARRHQVQERMSRAYSDLERLYAGTDFSGEEKRSQKRALLVQLKADLEGLGASRGGEINNPMIAQFRTYHDAGPEWRRLWELCARSPERLLERVRTQVESRGGPQGEAESERLTRFLGQITDCSGAQR